MSKNKFRLSTMAAFAAIVFCTSSAFAQKIKTPNTKNELVDKTETSARPRMSPKKDVAEESLSEESSSSSYSNAPAQRKLQQHGLGLGIGQNFLLGNYGKYGADKIAADVLYSYAASHSFDLLINAHSSEQKKNKRRMRTRGLSASIKARAVEYDNFSPFLLGGLGFYAPQAYRPYDGNSYKWTKEKITFGLNFGGGVDLRLNEKFVVGVMGTLHWPFTVSQDNQSDLKGYYFKLLLTGMYLF